MLTISTSEEYPPLKCASNLSRRMGKARNIILIREAPPHLIDQWHLPTTYDVMITSRIMHVLITIICSFIIVCSFIVILFVQPVISCFPLRTD